MDLKEQLGNFWRSIGIFTKVTSLVCIVSFGVQNALMPWVRGKDEPDFEKVALCPAAVIDEYQWFRLVTSEVTHGSLAHILCNMVMFLLWGVDLEKYFGTLFYMCLNLAIGLLSNLINCYVAVFQAYYVPRTVFGSDAIISGGHHVLAKCSVGYSNILFGLMVLEASIGTEKYRSLFGLIKVRKVYIPFILMVVIQLSLPEASLTGHLAGIISALIVRYAGIGRLLLPPYEWICAFEQDHPDLVERMERRLQYFKSSQGQKEMDFQALSFLIIPYKALRSRIRKRVDSQQGTQLYQHHSLVGEESI
mmetsp:Transcript_982/g.1763  ORF Transcript_982/g.1763 Transcript_982/m.1763 type:complete len:306 (+) Transcript_982:2-919(+)